MAIMISIIRLSFKVFVFMALGSAAFAQTTNFANVAVSGTATVGTVSATSISGGITGSTITSSTLASPVITGTPTIPTGVLDYTDASPTGGFDISASASCPNTMAVIQAHARPIRTMIFGDSLSSGMSMPKGWVNRGYFKLGHVNLSGSATVTTSTNWINNQVLRIEAGESIAFLYNATTPVAGDTLGISYIKSATSGTGVMSYSTTGTGGPWTTVSSGTFSAVNGSLAGGTNSWALGTSNYPRYVARLEVTGGSIDVVGVGIWYSTGPGYIDSSGLSNLVGQDLTVAATTPVEILEPLWDFYAPDLCISLWADAWTEWDEGGAWRTMYDRFASYYSETDFLTICNNPIQNGLTETLAQAASQRAWAIEEGQPWVDGLSIFGTTYDIANARGYMSDTVHPNALGKAIRDNYIWGATGLSNPDASYGRVSFSNYPATAQGSAPDYPDISYHGGPTAGYFQTSRTVRSNPAGVGTRNFLLADTSSAANQLDFSRDVYVANDAQHVIMSRGSVAPFRVMTDTVLGSAIPHTRAYYSFEGATDDTIETLLTVTDPTSSDKTITLPNQTGTVLLDTGGSISADMTWSDVSEGPVVKSPDGNRWRLAVDNTGTVSATDLDP